MSAELMALLRSGRTGRHDTACATHEDARALFLCWREEATRLLGVPRALDLGVAAYAGCEWVFQRAGCGQGVRTVRVRVGLQDVVATVLVDVEPAKPALAPN
jgi:hypothetical protein